MSITSPNAIRRSLIAGSWYPGDAKTLRSALDQYLNAADAVAVPGTIRGLIAPHAGYTYSGPVAAHAYKQIMGKAYDLVIVIAPLHRMYAGPVAITQYSHYQTPLGLVPVDQELVKALSQRMPVEFVSVDNEHSLEIQLPFLQHVLPQVNLMPIMLGTQQPDACQQLGVTLAELVKGRQTMWVASTDLSHFHSQAQAQRLDGRFIEAVNAFDPAQLARDMTQGAMEACGIGPVLTVMAAVGQLDNAHARILHYATSGDVTGDLSNVVGYAAGVLYTDQ